MIYIIKLGTITRAQRCINILREYGIRGTIGRHSNPSKSEGCGYTVKVKVNDIDYVLSILKRNGIVVLGVDGV